MIDGLVRIDYTPVARTRRRTELLEGFKRKYHVLRRDGCAVLPFCFGPQPESGRGEIVRKADAFGEEPVHTRDFVERGHQKRIVDLVDTLRAGAFDSGDQHAVLM